MATNSPRENEPATIGRTEMSGPVSGIYHSFCLNFDCAVTGTGGREIGFYLPFQFKLLRVDAHVDEMGAGNDLDIDIRSGAAPATTTSRIGAPLTLTADNGTASAGPAAGDDTTISDVGNNDLGAVRSDRFLCAQYTNNTANVVQNVTVLLSGYIMGHINDDPADDV